MRASHLVVFLALAVSAAFAVPVVSPPALDDVSGEIGDMGREDFWLKVALSAFLVLIGGVMAGLTIGLMGLDMVNLQVISNTGSPSDRKAADRVLDLLGHGRHWLLVTLLLTNVIVNESLPIFLHSVVGGGFGAVVVSTGLIVIFGEVIPQAACARYGLRIGAACTPFVLTLMYLEFPIAYPIAKLLDFILGESHGTTYKKAELKSFVRLHGLIGEDLLNQEEITMINSVLELSDKQVLEIMTPLEDTYCLSADTILDQEKVAEILALGHSRIPIHAAKDPRSFLGMLIVKKLISYDPAQASFVSEFSLSVLPESAPEATCLDALHYFQQGRSHMLLVSTTPGVDGGAVGVVSLEDVMEELIGSEIVDESDVYVDMHQRTAVVRPPSIALGLALAPLIRGIIERHIEYRKSLYECGGPVSNSVDFVLNPSTSSEKRRPGSRSVSLARGRGRRSVSRNSNYGTRIDLESQGDGAEDGVGDEERQPLLVAR